MTENREKKPKIIVDEDWKTRVQAEKEAIRQQSEEQGKGADAKTAEPELPPASFSLLVTTLAAQAMVAMGQAPDPIEKKPTVRLDVARHYIDTLGVLEDKTKGNLAPDESALLDDILHQLRMAFVAIRQPSDASRRP
jgi:hypothetical protein